MVWKYMALRGSRQRAPAAGRAVTASRRVLPRFTRWHWRRVAQFRRKDLARWLCDFLNLDLRGANEAALVALGFELALFCDDEPTRLYLPPDYERQRQRSSDKSWPP